MEFFFDQVRVILTVLGFDVTRPPASTIATRQGVPQPPVFALQWGGVVATAQEIDGKFVVFAASTARKQDAPSRGSHRALREKLVADGCLVDDSDPTLLEFAADVAFDGPGAAASVVMARASSGRKDWRVGGTGQTYGEWKGVVRSGTATPEPQADA